MERQRSLDQHEEQDAALNYSALHPFGIPNFPQNPLYSPIFFETPQQYFGGEPVNLQDQNYLLSKIALSKTDQMDCPGIEFSNGSYHSSDSYCCHPANRHTSQLQHYSRGLNDQSCPRTYPRLSYQQQITAKIEINEVAPNYELNQICAHDSAEDEQELSRGIDPLARLSISNGQIAPKYPRPLTAASPTRPTQFDNNEQNAVDGAASIAENQISDEPYAKLIYRALLGAPRRSMVLQEIYQWFIDNTDKGSATSSGWRNSIRHNLSMNAAFRKSERISAKDDGKKNSEWVLEPFAIKNGVTPTTRYRKNGKKSLKSENPTPSRVSAGRKGGISAGKIKSHKLKTDINRQESARSLIRESQQKRSQACQGPAPPPMGQRQISPPTPLITPSTSSPYYYKPSLYEDNFGDTEYKYGLEDVTGVYHEDAPIFCHDGLPRYPDNSPYIWPSY